MAGGRRHPILRALLILALGVFGLLVIVAGIAVLGSDQGPMFGNAVGVVELRGVIQDAKTLVALMYARTFRPGGGGGKP